ncbi:MAG: HEAT repeat domain-containing protein [Saprospiraceae bacterium]|nr:HEAT repeat domain-containing protein [Saprospiraceae bacterium]
MPNQLQKHKSASAKFNTWLSRFFLVTKFGMVFYAAFLFPFNLRAQSADSIRPLPPVQWMRTQTVDIHHIALDLRFDFAKKQALGEAEITLSLLAPTTQITLDAGFMTIQSVAIKGCTEKDTPVNFTYEGGDKNDNLLIPLDRKYDACEKLTLRIAYHTNYHNDSDPNNLWGSYGKGLRFFSPTSTEPRKRRQIWSMGEPYGNRYWFPGWDAPGDFRTTELRATVEQPLTVISNGKLVSKKNNPDATTTFHWKMDTPHANHQTSIVVGEYLDFQQTWNGIELHNFGYPDEQAATRASVERLPDMVRFFSEITGNQYPYPTYNQIFVQDFPWGGGHNIGSSTISENMIDDFGTHADFFYLWDGVEAQDLAAQWFGNLLTPRDWQDAWLSKSFAFYFDCLYTEYKNGHDEMLLWNRNFQHTTWLADWQAGIRKPVVTRHYDDPATMAFDNFPLRGAMVLHLLRKHLGDDNWRKAIQFYVKNNAGKLVTTEDFRKAIEATTGQPMDWFFDQWVYRTGHPVFEVLKNYDKKNHQLTLTVNQLQKPDPKNPYPQVEFFQGKIEVEIDGRIEQIWLKPTEQNTFAFAADTEPKLVNFDVESTWIKELVFEKTPEELMYLLQYSQDIVARRAALFELAAWYQKEDTPASKKNDIEAALRSVISGNAYWRLRNSALLTLQNLVAGQPLDKVTETLLLDLIKTEKSWLRSAGITFLGMAKDPKHADLFIQYFNDASDRVVNAAANALGKSKSPKAFRALTKLIDKPSWKNQSLISALNGLRELGDPRGAALALDALKDEKSAPRWTLATPIWDFRLAAAETLVALGKANEGYPIVDQRFKKSITENDVNDIFANVLLMVTLGDARGLEVFPVLRSTFKDDANALKAVDGYEEQLRNALK